MLKVIKIAKTGGSIAKNTRRDIEDKLGGFVVTKENALNYKYIDDKKKIGNK